MYQQVLCKIWPSLIGVPLIINSGVRSSKHRPLLIMLIFLILIYIAGAVSGKYSYGRVISYIVFILHIVMAEHFAIFEAKIAVNNALALSQRLIITASVTFFALFLSFIPLKETLRRAFFKKKPSYEAYLFLSKVVGQYEVVFADKITSWIVPTFGGKVVVAAHPLAFVPDQYVRDSDVTQFFSPDTADTTRRQILQKYNTDYLLLTKPDEIIYQSVAAHETAIFENDKFILISLKQHMKNPSQIE